LSGVVRERENGGGEEGRKEAVLEGGNGGREERRNEKEINSNSKKDIGNDLKTSSENTGKSSSESDLNAVSKSSETLPRSRSKAGGVYLEPNRSKVEGGDGALSITKNANVVNAKEVKGRASDGRTPSVPEVRLQNDNKPGKPSSDGRKDQLFDVGASDAGSLNKGNVLERDANISVGESMPQPAEPARTLISASSLNGKLLKWNVLLLPGISNPVQEVPEAPAPEKPPLSADEQPLWAVRFGYSPDLSTVGLKNFSKPGTSVSLLVEYSVLPRLYLQSGVVWSRKDYYAPADAYQLPKIPHYYPPAMTSVDGICKVLEVPLNIRYDIAHGKRSRWFASGGFSSYHMNEERYDYHFEDENDPRIRYRYWNGKTGWYLFSHANISAGYEYRISRKLSLLAEPSIRMPLKRVGYGNVNLITAGLWLSVRYAPSFK
jgi:hypothetical protein